MKTSERVERGRRSSKSSDRGGRGEQSRSRSSQRVRNDLGDKHEDKHVDRSVKVEADAVKDEMTD